MKKIFLFLLIVIFGLGLVSSCSQKPVPQKVTTTVTNEKVTYEDQGFYVEQLTILAGNTVWGISDRIYGTGTKWRDIVAQNPFLNSKDRLYYNFEKKMWIVKIYPGETLNIGGQKVYPSCTAERTTTTTTTEPVPDEATATMIPWWGWLLIVALALLCVILSHPILWPGFASSSSSSSSAVRVNINQPGCIDLETRRALLEREQGFRDRTLKIIEDGAINGRLRDFFVAENSEAFMASGSFRNGQATETKKEEDKK